MGVLYDLFRFDRLIGGVILFGFMLSASPYVIMWWLDLIDIDFWVDLIDEVFGGGVC